MNMKKLLALLLVAIMVFGIAGCGGGSSGGTTQPAQPSTSGGGASTSAQKVNIVWSHNAPEQTAAHQAAIRFKQLVEERSGGNITVDLYPNGELGSVPENDQALREGTIQMCAGTTGGLVDMSLSYFDAPNLVTSLENAMEVFGRDTELRIETEKRYEALNMKLLSFIPAGFRATSSNKAIRSYEDLAGLKIRTLENPVPIAYWGAWGARPTPIAFGELYIALQQGLVEAQENAYDTIVASKLYEQQKYVTNTNHVVMWGAVVMNLDFYNSLPEEYKELINDVWANDLDQFTYNSNKSASDAAKKVMEDAGLEIIDLPESDLIKMREAAKPAYDLIRQTAGNEIMDKIEKVLSAQ